MKKLITLTMILAILFSICGCSSNGDNTENVELSQADKQNIELINNSIKKWDVTVRDGSEDISINKISFNKVELSDMGVSGVGFFVNYPIGWYYVSCIIIDSSNKKIERLDINKLSTNEKTYIDGYFMQTSINGIDWDSNATDEQKYSTLEEAYKKYLESENSAE